MAVQFDDDVHVHYRQFYVESGTDGSYDQSTSPRGGQVNGLCGAAVPGMLFLTTGLHTGSIQVTVEVLDAPAPVGDEWEDVVEVSFRPTAEQVFLVQWAGEASWPLSLDRIDYRVRYCATGMDRACEVDTRLAGEPLVDRYLLQFWPAPAEADAVIRETTEIAAYWHAAARSAPPPPTADELAATKKRELLARMEAARAAEKAATERRWGGPPPSKRLRGANGATVMAGLDRNLLDSVDNADSATQRAVAVWAAHRACAIAGLAELDWVAAALAALDRDQLLADDVTQAFDLLNNDPRVRYTTVRSYDDRHDLSRQHAALPAVWSAAHADPLVAAMESLFHTVVTAGRDYPGVLAELRQAFPALTTR